MSNVVDKQPLSWCLDVFVLWADVCTYVCICSLTVLVMDLMCNAGWLAAGFKIRCQCISEDKGTHTCRQWKSTACILIFSYYVFFILILYLVVAAKLMVLLCYLCFLLMFSFCVFIYFSNLPCWLFSCCIFWWQLGTCFAFWRVLIWFLSYLFLFFFSLFWIHLGFLCAVFLVASRWKMLNCLTTYHRACRVYLQRYAAFACHICCALSSLPVFWVKGFKLWLLC